MKSHCPEVAKLLPCDFENLLAEEGRFPGELIIKDVVGFWKENNFCCEYSNPETF